MVFCKNYHDVPGWRIIFEMACSHYLCKPCIMKDIVPELPIKYKTPNEMPKIDGNPRKLIYKCKQCGMV